MPIKRKDTFEERAAAMKEKYRNRPIKAKKSAKRITAAERAEIRAATAERQRKHRKSHEHVMGLNRMPYPDPWSFEEICRVAGIVVNPQSFLGPYMVFPLVDPPSL